MKILTKEEEEEHYRATVKGGIKGAIIGLGVSLGVSLVAQRYSRFYQHLTLPIKAFLVSSGATAACITSAERAGLNYERRRYGFYQPVKEPHQQLPTTRVVKDFISENRYSIVCGSWALSMAGSLAYTYRNKYLTFAQKVVQARMYAQALTIVMVLATAGLSMSSNQPKITVGSDQWKEIVAAEERKMNKIQEIKDHE
ncbi:mitochondrial hypoxia responsive domain containing protein [Gigaspora margarita]|uniref:Mitochondrial hypoxia responsive domain containing protein n=1 Tax=Gigaspora margarita TaxID=4874 RepID=A0A8H4EH71_GIGMA|nr:mitochondrial hypoxia responsive domain containing protein [Gigaspora margarita]